MSFLTTLNYRSVADLNRCILENLHKVPQDIEMIVGIPRSGLLAANLIALHLNLPLADLETFIAGRNFMGGERLRFSKTAGKPVKNVLVVDDSVYSGFAMRKAKERILNCGIRANFVYACVFLNADARGEVDLFFELCPIPRIFEWNLMHDSIIENACFDIDGVLCRDPTEDENDDGPKYRQFLSTVPPLIVPSVPIGHLVTSRLEKYRDLTEAWMAKHGIKYGKLVMTDYPDKATRVRDGKHGENKANYYRSTTSLLFVESSLHQAKTIVQLTGKSVFCTETREMLSPDTIATIRRAARRGVPHLIRRVKRVSQLFRS
jgi:uncharacterized HAD superfamily protein/adenine/guanine phosphoribosyltransferase-like PRPP-binding protein